MNRALAAVVVLASLASGPALAKAPERDLAWVSSQLERWLPSKEGSPPYRLRARLELVGEDGSKVPGRYVRDWISPSRWREQIEIADYRDSQGLDGNRRWSLRNLPFRPWQARLAAEAFDFELQPDMAVHRTGLGRTCVDHAGVRRCLDAEGSLALREHAWARVRHDYSRPVSFVLGPWPEHVRLTDNRRQVGTVILEAFEPLSASVVEGFRVPEGARTVPSCASPRWPKVRPGAKALPDFPTELRLRRVPGYAVLLAELDDEGRVVQVHPLRASHPQYAAAARAAVARWRYEPALCDGTPVPFEVLVTVQFTLS